METVSSTTYRRYKAGYELRRETFEDERGVRAEVKTAYTPEGHYIGDSKEAHYLCVKKGIKPEPRSGVCRGKGRPKVCTIGFCERDQKWYGWSHRAIFGFGIGSVAKEGDCCTISGWTDEYLEEDPDADVSVPVGFEAKTLDDAKRMAIAFADSVG